jgi:RNA polymerase sigma-70 factor (ECF subfamily)
MALAREGSFAALGQLFDHYRDFLLCLANQESPAELKPKVAPSDLVQETFLQAAKAFPQFRGTTEQEFRAWLKHILIHNLQDAQRRYLQSRKRNASLEVPLESPDSNGQPLRMIAAVGDSPSKQLIASEQQAALRAAVSRLPRSKARIVEMRSFAGLSFEQIAAELGRPRETVRKIWSRAIDSLVEELSKHDSR